MLFFACMLRLSSSEARVFSPLPHTIAIFVDVENGFECDYKVLINVGIARSSVKNRGGELKIKEPDSGSEEEMDDYGITMTVLKADPL